MAGKTPESYGDVDNWITQLKQCKPLSEADVEKLCEKVGFFPLYSFYFTYWLPLRQEKFL